VQKTLENKANEAKWVPSTCAKELKNKANEANG
jgi:hypothetical protein